MRSAFAYVAWEGVRDEEHEYRTSTLGEKRLIGILHLSHQAEVLLVAQGRHFAYGFYLCYRTGRSLSREIYGDRGINDLGKH